MPYGRYPERVKDFRKWSTDRVDKATINDRATGAKSTGSKVSATRRRKRRKKAKEG